MYRCAQSVTTHTEQNDHTSSREHGSKPTCTKLSEQQQGESGVSELLNAATQALADKLASVVPSCGSCWWF